MTKRSGNHNNNHNNKVVSQNNENVNKTKKRKEPITYYELLELEKEQNEGNSAKVKIIRNFPIAPDGFIPNTVVKKYFDLFDEKDKQQSKTIWKLKWKPNDAEAIVEEDTESEYENREYILSSEDEALNDDKDDELQKFLADLVRRLKEHVWFKQPSEVTIESIVKFLINKLIERDPSNHTDICRYIKEIIDRELVEWVVMQLEEELDGTNPTIISNNIKLISMMKYETLNKDKELTDEALEILKNMADVDDAQIEFVTSNAKKLQNLKHKKIDDFKLRKFIVELEEEIAESLKEKGEESVLNNEVLKAILREEWIPSHIKENLKTLHDFLNYLLKSLKSVKSKIFYEKLANHLFNVYNEFKLGGTDWELQILEHFLQNGADAKFSEPIRLVEIDNLSKYYPSLKDVELKHKILIELLRSAAFEKTRSQVANAARNLLKSLTNMADDDLNNLIKFFETKPTFAKSCPFTWSEIMSIFRSNPGISERDLYLSKGLAYPGDEDKHHRDGKGKHKGKDKHKNKAHKEKKEKANKVVKEHKDEAEKVEKIIDETPIKPVKEVVEPTVVEKEKKEPIEKPLKLEKPKKTIEKPVKLEKEEKPKKSHRLLRRIKKNP